MHVDYRQWLKDILRKKQAANPQYSLRAFARDLSIPNTLLSEVLNSKRALSKERAQNISEKLFPNNQLRKFFVDLVVSSDSANRIERELARQEIETFMGTQITFNSLQKKYIQMLSRWWDFAILEYVGLNHGKVDYDKLSNSIGITKDEIDESIDTLTKLGLLERTKEGLVKADEMQLMKAISLDEEVKKQSIKNFHEGLMEYSLSKILGKPEVNDFSACFIRIDKTRIREFKDKFKALRREFAISVEQSSEEKDALMVLSTQFYPVLDED